MDPLTTHRFAPLFDRLARCDLAPVREWCLATVETADFYGLKHLDVMKDVQRARQLVHDATGRLLAIEADLAAAVSRAGGKVST